MPGGSALSGLAVTFTPAEGATLKPVIGTTYILKTMVPGPMCSLALIGRKWRLQRVPPDIAENIAAMVPTDRSGEAQVYLELGDAGINGDALSKTVTVSVGGSTKIFDATSATTTDIPAMRYSRGRISVQKAMGQDDPLEVGCFTSNNRLFRQTVTFTTTTQGYLTTESRHIKVLVILRQ